VSLKSESVQGKVSPQKVSQQTRLVRTYSLDHNKPTIFNKVPLILLVLLCLLVLGFVGRGNFNRIIGVCKNVFAGKSLSSKILPSNVEANPQSPSVAQLPPNQDKPLDAVADSSSNLSSGETRTDPITPIDIQTPPNEDSSGDTSSNSSSNLFPGDLKSDPESSNNTRILPVEFKPEARNDSIKVGKIKGVVVTKKKDCIFSLAQKHYDAANGTLVDFILESNPEIENIHLIDVNQKIKIPEITVESPIIELPDDTYKIHLGTFLTEISAKSYKQELSLGGKRLEIIPVRVSPDERWYRVVAGSFGNKDECLEVIVTLKEKALLPLFGNNWNIRRFPK
jgi:hypothetical protein